MILNNARWFLILVIGLISAIGFGQQQPPQAVNQQDEVVNLLLRPDEGPQDVLRILRSDDKAETNRYVTKAFELKNTTAY